MGQPLLAVVTAAALGLGLRLALGGAQVDARPAGVVDGHLGIHRLVAQPAAPPVLLADLVEPARRPHLTLENRRIPAPYRPITRPLPAGLRPPGSSPAPRAFEPEGGEHTVPRWPGRGKT